MSSWNFCSHEEALRIGVQSFWVIHRQRASHALSRISRTTDFSVVWVVIGADTGLAKIVLWSDNPTFGNCDRVNSLDLLVKNQSNVPVSRVLKDTSCFNGFTPAMYCAWNPVEVGLKSPVNTTSALGCFNSSPSRFFCIWSRRITFSGSRLLVEW